MDFRGKSGSLRNYSVFFIIFVTLPFSGCGGGYNHLPPTPEQLAEFQSAGLVRPEVDINRLVRAKIPAGPYRVVKGDLLDLQIPSVLKVVNPEQLNSPEASKPYLSRVQENGTITVPIIGQVQAAGRTLAEIEAAIVKAYYPRHSIERPPVVARVSEYRTARISITGAVNNPGIYELRTDQMSLVSLIMAAGGIVDDGAALIRITPAQVASEEGGLIGGSDTYRPEHTADVIASAGPGGENKPVVLPVKGLNVPFVDVAVNEGDFVVVERLQTPLFTVLGLVNNPGSFPYPPDAQYTLMQALGFAGGLNLVADPRYATVYRQKTDRKIVSATFQVLNGSNMADSPNILIKPGDIVAVEHTSRTRTNLFLDRVFRINTGLYTTLRVIE